MRAIAWLGLAAVLAAAPAAYPKDEASYDKGQLLSMESTTCGSAEKESKTVAGEIIGTDAGHKQVQEVLCQEYVLQSERIVYRIRPTDAKHPVLLPVGEAVDFRIHKDKLFLRDPEGDRKERQYVVVSMQPRQELKTTATNTQ